MYGIVFIRLCNCFGILDECNKLSEFLQSNSEECTKIVHSGIGSHHFIVLWIMKNYKDTLLFYTHCYVAHVFLTTFLGFSQNHFLIK